MADDGPVPLDLENVGVHDTRTTQSDSNTSNDMSCEVACAIASWNLQKSVYTVQGTDVQACENFFRPPNRNLLQKVVARSDCNHEDREFIADSSASLHDEWERTYL